MEKEEFDEIDVHKGIQKQYIAVSKEVRATCKVNHLKMTSRILKKRFKELVEVFEDKKALEIIVTGHSLGGALAVLCALDFRLNPFLNDEKTMERSKSIKVITFGAPKVGDDEFRLVLKVYYV